MLPLSLYVARLELQRPVFVQAAIRGDGGTLAKDVPTLVYINDLRTCIFTDEEASPASL